MPLKESPTIDEALEFAVSAIEHGRPSEGRAALAWVLRQQPNNSLAWLWLACCVADERQKAECLRRVSTLQQ